MNKWIDLNLNVIATGLDIKGRIFLGYRCNRWRLWEISGFMFANGEPGTRGKLVNNLLPREPEFRRPTNAASLSQISAAYVLIAAIEFHAVFQ